MGGGGLVCPLQEGSADSGRCAWLQCKPSITPAEPAHAAMRPLQTKAAVSPPDTLLVVGRLSLYRLLTLATLNCLP